MASLIARVKQYGLLPDKKLGQHFLVSSTVVDKIVSAVPEGAGVLEVGPGPATLTESLANRFAVVAVEADPRWGTLLADVAPRAQVVIADALQTDLAQLLTDLPSPRAIVSNMPYNITGPLLERFDAARPLVDKMVLMMQREVAEKIVAAPGDAARGALSVVMQRRYQITKIADAPPGAFWPPPKVWSTVLSFEPRRETPESEPLLDLARAAFRMPRKTLTNNLRAAGYDLTLPNDWPAGIRPHQLTEAQWLTLTDRLT